MHVCVGAQPVAPGVAHTLVPAAAVQAAGDLQTMIVEVVRAGVLAQQTSPGEQSSALRQHPEISAQLPSALRVGASAFS
jgi:hypothetical protein